MPIRAQVQVAVGQPLQLTVEAAGPSAAEPDTTATPGLVTVSITHDFKPEAARKHPLDAQRLREQLGRLGGTVYQLEQLEVRLEGAPMVPLSVLGQLRHEMIHQLDRARATRPLKCNPAPVAPRLLAQSWPKLPASEILPRQSWPRLPVSEDSLGQSLPADEPVTTPQSPAQAQLRILCRSLQQLRQVFGCGARAVIADFHDLRDYRTAVALAADSGAQIELATLRIHKPGEDGLFHALRKYGAADRTRTMAVGPAAGVPVSWLVRNLAAVRCRQHSLPLPPTFR